MFEITQSTENLEDHDLTPLAQIFLNKTANQKLSVSLIPRLEKLMALTYYKISL